MAVLAIEGGDPVTHLSVDRVVSAEQVVPDFLGGQCQTVSEIFLHGFVVHSKTVKGVDVQGQRTLLPQTQHQVPVHVVQVVGDVLLHLFHQEALGQHENVHGCFIICRSGVVYRHIGDVALFVQLHSQIQQPVAVGNAGLGHQSDVLTACHMGGNDLGKVNVA